ncbi:MAG TPA: circadian clock protein KaiC [Bryobacteraceae bacterium]|jgi:circadian clock protein KaiC|nr:circadian clock protein KaiC [Bryobacteraceae bacterium]
MSKKLRPLPKAPTGIDGLDRITLGGLPRGRPTLICGSAGCGKTLFGIEFLVRGALQFNEPGVCITFEESARDLALNVASLGFDLEQLQKSKKLVIDHIYIDKSEIAETGEYDLEGLFIRLNAAIDSIKAKRVLLDTPEALFAGLSDTGVLRSELRRLFGWLKDKGVTAIITGERGEGTLTRHGLEEYVSDCVILLDHRVQNDAVTRRLRVLKYRGSTHGTSEYPFLIDEHGISVLPVTSLGLTHPASTARISSGIPDLDAMLEGHGYFRGSSVLVTGSAGTGKTSMGAHFVDSACVRGEKAILFSFEESPEQIIRNMRSIGMDLERWVKKGLLHIESARPTAFGLEMHLVRMHHLLKTHKPDVVVIDPISSLLPGGSEHDVQALVLRIVDFLKHSGATGFFTALNAEDDLQSTALSISSLVDAWILLRNIEVNGERNRLLYVLKSRGMAHSNQIREFLLTHRGVRLREVYLGPGGVLTGSARVAREADERRAEIQRQQEIQDRERAITASLRAVEAKIAALQAEKAAHENELTSALGADHAEKTVALADIEALRKSRGMTIESTGRTQRPNGREGKS